MYNVFQWSIAYKGKFSVSLLVMHGAYSDFVSTCLFWLMLLDWSFTDYKTDEDMMCLRRHNSCIISTFLYFLWHIDPWKTSDHMKQTPMCTNFIIHQRELIANILIMHTIYGLQFVIMSMSQRQVIRNFIFAHMS